MVVGQCGIEFAVEQVRFLHQVVVWPADVEPVGGQFVVARDDDLEPFGCEIHAR